MSATISIALALSYSCVASLRAAVISVHRSGSVTKAVLNAASIISGPEKTNAWGQTFTLDLGTPDSTLAISRDNRLPRTAVVVTLAARELMRLSKEGEKLEHIVVVGSEVDPTLHPGFREISENLRALRQKWFPRAKLVLISNAPSIDSAEVRIALGIYAIFHLALGLSLARGPLGI